MEIEARVVLMTVEPSDRGLLRKYYHEFRRNARRAAYNYCLEPSLYNVVQ